MAEAVSIVRGGNVRRSLKPKLRPAPNNEVIDLTAEPTFVELMQLEKLERLQKYASLGMTSSQMTAAANNFDAVNKEKMLALLVDEAFQSGKLSEVTATITKGNVEELSQNNALYNSVTYLHSTGMPYQDIAAELMQREIAQINYDEALSRSAEAQAKNAEEKFIADAKRAMIEGDDEAFQGAVTNLETTDKKAAAELEEEYAAVGQDRRFSDPDALDFLESKGIMLSFADLAGKISLLSDADKDKFRSKVDALESDEFTAAKSIIAGDMKISVRIQDMAANDPNLKRHAIFRQIIGELTLRKQMAARNQENFDAIQVGKTLVREMFTQHQALEFQEDKNQARNYINNVNDEELRDDDFQLDPSDFVAAQTYFQGVLTFLKKGESVGRFQPNDTTIQILEVYIEQMKKAQGQ